jgi:phytoene synthase
MRAYLHTALKFNIPKEVMTPYFRAMKEDLSITRFPTFDDLLHYMYGSAIPVGRAMTYILGVQPTYTIQDAISGADSLSIAMQLSNFWRDIAEDWDRGRIYLPVEDMERFSYSEGNLASQQISQNLVDLLEFQFARTEAYYQVARQSVKMLASGNWAIMSALNIYQAILSSIRDNGYDVFTHRAGTNKLQKTRRAISAFWAVSRK